MDQSTAEWQASRVSAQCEYVRVEEYAPGSYRLVGRTKGSKRKPSRLFTAYTSEKVAELAELKYFKLGA